MVKSETSPHAVLVRLVLVFGEKFIQFSKGSVQFPQLSIIAFPPQSPLQSWLHAKRLVFPPTQSPQLSII